MSGSWGLGGKYAGGTTLVVRALQERSVAKREHTFLPPYPPAWLTREGHLTCLPGRDILLTYLGGTSYLLTWEGHLTYLLTYREGIFRLSADEVRPSWEKVAEATHG